MNVKRFRENGGGLILCLMEVLVGVLLLIDPEGLTAAIIAVIGAVLFLAGVVESVRYFRMDTAQAVLSQSLLRGLAMLLIGGFCLLNSRWFIETFRVMTSIYGVIILFSGLGKIQWAVNLLRLKNSNWRMAAAVAGLSVLCAIVILANPFGTMLALWRFTGVFLVAVAVLDIVTIFVSGKYDGTLKG